MFIDLTQNNTFSSMNIINDIFSVLNSSPPMAFTHSFQLSHPSIPTFPNPLMQPPILPILQNQTSQLMSSPNNLFNAPENFLYIVYEF